MKRSSRSVQSSNLFSLAIVQLASCFTSFFNVLSPLSRVPIAAFGCLVAHVVGVRSKEKMRWVGALRVVALVKNMHSFWYRSKMKQPRNTARWALFLKPSRADHSVTFVGHTFPLPAPVRLFNFGPKSLCKRRCHNLMGLMQSPHYMQGA